MIYRDLADDEPNLPKSSQAVEDVESDVSERMFPLSGSDQEHNAETFYLAKKAQLQGFLSDLANGFSLKFAFQRFQYLNGPKLLSLKKLITDSLYSGTEKLSVENEEPGGVDRVREPEVPPLIDELILPRQMKRRMSVRNRNKALADIEWMSSDDENLELFDKFKSYTNINEMERNDDEVLRQKIVQIRNIEDLNDKDKGKLTQRLMSLTLTKAKGQTVFVKQKPANQDVSLIMPSYNDDGVFGCKHYQRNCKLQCPICLKWYTCRTCHDAQEVTHEMPTTEVTRIWCMECEATQPPSEECVNCENIFGEYFCKKCVLYDNDATKNIYHCDDCGICRLGVGLGVDYYHCHGCNACISVLLENDHKCIEDRTKCNCPICNNYMFTSKKKVVVMPCGHAIHQHCYDEYVKNYYKCPICSRTIINMAARFREIDNEIEVQPMPEPYNSWKCVVNCNDCNTKSICKYHILGLKCEICRSYNTAQLRLIKPTRGIDNGVVSDEGVEFEDDDTDDYSRLVNSSSQNDLFSNFFNDNSEAETRTTPQLFNPVISNVLTDNIRSMITSATTSNYYNEFVNSTKGPDPADDEDAYKDGDLFNFNNNFFRKRTQQKTQEYEENPMPSIKDVLRKWAQSTVGLSDSEEEGYREESE